MSLTISTLDRFLNSLDSRLLFFSRIEQIVQWPTCEVCQLLPEELSFGDNLALFFVELQLVLAIGFA